MKLYASAFSADSPEEFFSWTRASSYAQKPCPACALLESPRLSPTLCTRSFRSSHSRSRTPLSSLRQTIVKRIAGDLIHTSHTTCLASGHPVSSTAARLSPPVSPDPDQASLAFLLIASQASSAHSAPVFSTARSATRKMTHRARPAVSTAP